MHPPGDLTFPKTKRLVLPAEFARVKGQGTTQRGKYIVRGTMKDKDERGFRAGFVTPKHIGTAVVRALGGGWQAGLYPP